MTAPAYDQLLAMLDDSLIRRPYASELVRQLDHLAQRQRRQEIVVVGRRPMSACVRELCEPARFVFVSARDRPGAEGRFWPGGADTAREALT